MKILKTLKKKLKKNSNIFKKYQIDFINIWANNRKHDAVFILIGYGYVKTKNLIASRFIVFNFEIQFRKERHFNKK